MTVLAQSDVYIMQQKYTEKIAMWIDVNFVKFQLKIGN